MSERWLTRLARTEYDLDKAQATSAMAVLLTGIEAIRAQARARPTPGNRRFLEDLYVNLVTGALASLAAHPPPTADSPRRSG
jgi:hypothetical protein